MDQDSNRIQTRIKKKQHKKKQRTSFSFWNPLFLFFFRSSRYIIRFNFIFFKKRKIGREQK